MRHTVLHVMVGYIDVIDKQKRWKKQILLRQMKNMNRKILRLERLGCSNIMRLPSLSGIGLVTI